MSSTFHAGWACRVSAATPATCGEDIDVPKIVAATRAQVPRFTTAIVFGPSEPKSAMLQPSDSFLVVFGSSLMTLMLNVAEPGNANSLALIAGIVVPEKLSIAPGKVGYGS